METCSRPRRSGERLHQRQREQRVAQRGGRDDENFLAALQRGPRVLERPRVDQPQRVPGVMGEAPDRIEAGEIHQTSFQRTVDVIGGDVGHAGVGRHAVVGRARQLHDAMAVTVRVGADAAGRIIAVDDGNDACADGKTEMHDAGISGDERAGAGQQRGRVGEGEFTDEIEIGLRAAAEMLVELRAALDLVLAAEHENLRGQAELAHLDQLRVALNGPVAPRRAPAAAELEDEPRVTPHEHAPQRFLDARPLGVGHGVDELRVDRVRAHVARQPQRLLDAVGLVPVGLVDLMAAKPAHPRHVRRAHRDVGIEKVAQAAWLGIIAAQMQDRVPRPGVVQFLRQAAKRERTFLEKKNLVHAGIVLNEQAPAAMHDGAEMHLGKCFPQRTEDDGIGQRVADARAGEAKDARFRGDHDDAPLRRTPPCLGAEDRLVGRGGEAAEERGHVGSGAQLGWARRLEHILHHLLHVLRLQVQERLQGLPHAVDGNDAFTALGVNVRVAAGRASAIS